MAIINLEKLLIEKLDQSQCEDGHDWQQQGGRPCPRHTNVACLQIVYICKRCGAFDLITPGGLTYTECFDQCNIEERADYDKDFKDLFLPSAQNSLYEIMKPKKG